MYYSLFIETRCNNLLNRNNMQYMYTYKWININSIGVYEANEVCLCTSAQYLLKRCTNTSPHEALFKQVMELKKKITVVKRATTFSVRELKHDEKNSAEEYYWAMTQAAGRSCYCRSGYSV